ncbi:hypothetical protein GGS26DRAFT_594544 [Hypomontagnella submonticulosa]|nr:hypothetical protein GGS26DRAFT_594544 [Hypomontagnella submonticulosa]
MRPQTTIIVAASLAVGAAAPTSTLSLDPAFKSCLVPYSSVLNEFPRISNAELANLFNHWSKSNPAAQETSPCAIASAIPPSLTAEAASFQSQVASYVSAHASAISSDAKLCAPFHTTTIGAITFDPAADFQAVTAYADPSCFKKKAQGTSVSSSSSTTNAAPACPTSVVANAAAAVGFMGAVALL